MLNTENPIKILIINTDPLMTDYLCTILTPPTFSVFITEATPETLRATAQDAEIFLMDVTTFNGNGCSMCQEIRKFSSMPIVLLSSVQRPGLVEQALDAGADEYLIKPLPANVLIAHIKTLARRARAEKRYARTTSAAGFDDHNRLLAY